MKVLIVATQIRLPDTHGGSTHVSELLASFKKYGQALALVRKGSTAGDCIGIADTPNFKPVIKHLNAIKFFHHALLEARRFKPHAIYERGSSYGLGALLSLALGVPMICMVLDEHYSLLSLYRAKAIIATNLKLIPPLFRHKGVAVSWGANPDLFNHNIDKRRARQELNISQDQRIVAYTGSFRAWHGLDVLVEAAAFRNDLNTFYMLIGDGPERARIRKLVDKRNLKSRFIFPGAVPYDQVPDLLAAADVCVAPFLPGLHAGSTNKNYALDPLKVFEYLAMRIPVITINTPNMRARFTDGAHLKMVPPGDPTALAEAIDQLLNDRRLAGGIAESGYRCIIEKYTWASHVQQLFSIFNDMV